MNLKHPFFWLLVAVTAVFFAGPAVGNDIGLRESLFLSAIYIILATNLNLVIGYTGYVNFGNIVFFGLGGYIGTYLLSVMGWPLILAALAAGFAVSSIALLFGLGILRLRGAFFALATIGVNEAVKAFVSNFEPWGGATGMYLALSAYAPFGGPKAAQWTIYYVMIGVMGLSLFLSYGIKKSKFGLGLFAIREDEDAAAVLGVKTPVFKAVAYSVSGFMPALAGALFFIKNGVIQPEQAFDLHLSIEAIVMVMLGGQGTIIGPALGAYVYEQLRSYLLTAEAFASFQRHRRRLVARDHSFRAGRVDGLAVPAVPEVDMSLSDRIVVLDFGQKLAEGSPQEVINDPLVVQAYLGDPDMAKKLQRER